MPFSIRATRVSVTSHEITRIFLAIRRRAFPPKAPTSLAGPRTPPDGTIHDGIATMAPRRPPKNVERRSSSRPSLGVAYGARSSQNGATGCLGRRHGPDDVNHAWCPATGVTSKPGASANEDEAPDWKQTFGRCGPALVPAALPYSFDYRKLPILARGFFASLSARRFPARRTPSSGVFTCRRQGACGPADAET
jgi:hypothetical protein